MNSLKRVAALACIGLLVLCLSAPMLAATSGETTSDPSLLELFWQWLVETFGGDTTTNGGDDGGDDDDTEGSLQIPPGNPNP
jgi:hypothetical protein